MLAQLVVLINVMVHGCAGLRVCCLRPSDRICYCAVLLHAVLLHSVQAFNNILAIAVGKNRLP